MRIPIIAVILMLLNALVLNGQNSIDDTTKVSKPYLGSELKGIYIGGGMAAISGASVGLIMNAFDEYPRKGLPFITTGIVVAPTSLVGLGLGSLFAQKHSSFTDHFRVGVGMAYSSPIFSEFVSGNSHRAGINVRFISKEIGPIRYTLGFAKFASEDYDFERIEAYHGRTNLNWWELNLNLQYVIDITETLKFYPFVGTQYNSVHSEGSKIKNEILTNYGVGVEKTIFDRWDVFAEVKLSIDPNDNPGNYIYSLGLLYSL